ncbi:glutathionylspermidine synthase family protein [Dyadobacter tibetensis]|uniref:glutathionylspermidine synthase family protein n=1 Tax=Dyadobacter tibetensis TaxID=1211851 RepID=UPI00046F2B41|nr:glutathionylspermidine synthase family protein [Dyadobacter tibetensis]
MIELKNMPVPPTEALRNAGWDWMIGQDTIPYLVDQVVSLDLAATEQYYEAANTLYEMFIEAGQYAIDQNLFKEMGISENLIELVKLSWEDDRHTHLYGRFDLAGGLEGEPIKLLEFNADTATCIPETAIVQWAQLKMNGLDESMQFNTVYESLVEQFRYVRRGNTDLTPTILFSSLEGYPEDEANVAVLMEAAKEAGFDVDKAYIQDVEFSTEQGIFKQEPDTGHFVRFDFWFKLVPWEQIGADEPELTQLLTQLAKDRKVLILNPAYTLLFQSKYIMKLLWDLFPYHPLLLQTETRALTYKQHVKKVILGREGANVSIIEKDGTVVESVGGEYADQASIYQEYTSLQQDASGRSYQAGVFYAGEACGLGFRRGGKILDNTAQFVGHVVD